MNGWLSRAVANTALRGEDGRNRVARWSRSFPATPTVGGSRFQGPNEPYPRHWREFPEPWPSREAVDATVRAELRDAMSELPRVWRKVIQQRDVQGRSPADVSNDLQIDAAQQRQMLNRARAVLRERLAGLLTSDDAR
jgi:RNA polymerase sigma-70 factor (ECF subfamily)